MPLTDTRNDLGDADANAQDADAIVRHYRSLCTAQVSSAMLFQSAAGCHVRDAHGRDYLDFLSGFGAASTGWRHPRVMERSRAQSERDLFAPPVLATREGAELAHMLLEVLALPEGWRVVRAAGGADANEQALKAASSLAAARDRPGPHRFVCFERAYHGGSLTTLALSDRVTLSLGPASAGHPHPRFPLPATSSDVTQIESLIERDRSVAGVILEPVIGSGGVFPIAVEALRALRDCCTRHGVSLIFDEVMTGCGRVGAMAASHMLDVTPDALTLGKGLSGGTAPLGAALLCPELAHHACRDADTTSTFAWTPFACAVTLENLAVIEDENLAPRAALHGQALRVALAHALNSAFGDLVQVRGVGLMVGASVRAVGRNDWDSGVIRRIVVRCLKEGLIVGASWDWKHLLLLPPLTISLEQCDEGVAKIARAALATARGR